MECCLELTEETDGSLIGLRVFECPLGHRTYRSKSNVSILLFRRSVEDETWHFVKECSQWPSRDFVESGILSSVVCSECIVRSRINA
jgi:hypothetical protein